MSGFDKKITQPLQPTLSVIIPVSHGGTSFYKCLIGLAKAVTPSTEVIIVADGETDGSWRLGEAWGAQVVHLPAPQGPGKARNTGAKSAQGDILLFIDADVVIPPDAILHVEEVFKQSPGLTALFGSYDDQPGENNFLSQYKNLFHHYTHQTAREKASTFWSGCGAIRRSVFLELGGFSESYKKPSIEDVELGYRLKQAGYSIRLVKTLQAKHLKRWNIRNLLISDFFDRALPWTELILRDRNFVNDLNINVSGRLSVFLTYFLLFSLIVSIGWKGIFFFSGMSAFVLFLVNFSFYRYFFKKRGFWFTAGTIPWHWFYFLYSGLAFGIGSIRFYISRCLLHKGPRGSF